MSDDYVRELEATVDEAAATLASLPEYVVTWRRSPSEWSAKETSGGTARAELSGRAAAPG